MYDEITSRQGNLEPNSYGTKVNIKLGYTLVMVSNGIGRSCHIVGWQNGLLSIMVIMNMMDG